jgi:hypothetical protein
MTMPDWQIAVYQAVTAVRDGDELEADVTYHVATDEGTETLTVTFRRTENHITFEVDTNE